MAFNSNGKSAEKLGFYGGSFDPIHLGHVDIVRRSLKIFDKVVVGIGNNSCKKAQYSAEQRMKMLSAVVANTFKCDKHRIIALEYQELTYVKAIEYNATAFIRGIRNNQDFHNEVQLAGLNEIMLKQNYDIITIMIPADYAYQLISSNRIKEIKNFGGSVEELVPSEIIDML